MAELIQRLLLRQIATRQVFAAALSHYFADDAQRAMSDGARVRLQGAALHPNRVPVSGFSSSTSLVLREVKPLGLALSHGGPQDA